jgi:drug/metabolite transporter (DMT)-like permease
MRFAGMAGIGIVLVILAAVISGVSNFVNFYAVQGTNSDAFVSTRNLVTAGLLVPVFLLTTRLSRVPLQTRDWLRLALIGLIGGAIPFLLFFHGLQLATQAGGAATATFAYRTLFIMATVFGIVFLRERFHWRIALAASLLLVGNILLLSFFTPLWTTGTGYVLVATLLWAVEYTVSRATLRTLPSATVALGRMGFGALFLFGYLAVTAQVSAIGTFSGAQWDWMVISAVLLTAFVTTWYAGLKYVEVGPATSILTLGFPITWMLGIFFHGTPYTVGQVAGAVVVSAGVLALVSWPLVRELRRQLGRGSSLRPDV